MFLDYKNENFVYLLRCLIHKIEYEDEVNKTTQKGRVKNYKVINDWNLTSHIFKYNSEKNSQKNMWYFEGDSNMRILKLWYLNRDFENEK